MLTLSSLCVISTMLLGVKIECSSGGCARPGPSADMCAAIRSSPCMEMDTLLFNPIEFFYCSFQPLFAERHDEGGKESRHHENGQIHLPSFSSLFLFFLLMLPLLAVYFFILYVAANDHLTPSLGLLAKWLHLSPTVAGVTLLAFGNGAPDFFTSLAGVERLDSVPLIVAGAVGSGLFVTVFVFGLVIISVAPHPDKTKDVSGKGVSKDGNGHDSISNPPSVDGKDVSLKTLPRAGRETSGGLLKAPLNRSDPQPYPEAVVSDPTRLSSPFSFITNILMYLFAVLLLLAVSVKKKVTLAVPIFGLSVYLLNIGIVLIKEFAKRFRKKNGSESIKSMRSGNTIDADNNDSRSVNHLPSNGASCSKDGRCQFSLFRLCSTSLKGYYAGLSDYAMFRRVFLVILSPVYFVIMMTVPPLFISDDDGLQIYEEGTPLKSMASLENLRMATELHGKEKKQSARSSGSEAPDDALPTLPKFTLDYVRLIFNPFFSIALIMTIMRYWMDDYLYGLAMYVSISAALFVLTKATSDPWKRPIYRPFLVVYSFIVCTLWIYGISKEVVNLFQSMAIITPGVSQSVLGMTLLAWGNSFGDLVVDMAIATNANGTDGGGGSNFELAVTGIFCGPVLNVLLSLCLSFVKVLVDGPSIFESASIKFDPIIYVGLFFLLATLLLSLAMIAFAWGFERISRWYGYLLVALYVGVFIPLAILLGGDQIDNLTGNKT